MVHVRRCTVADMAALRRRAVAGLRHHEEPFAAQERGWCDFLLAFDEGGHVVGHVIVRNSSKYDSVIAHLGLTPEVNGLAAYPTGAGAGTALLEVAEDVAAARGASHVGLAVERPKGGSGGSHRTAAVSRRRVSGGAL